MEIIQTPKQQAPNATSSFVLGILSVVFTGLIGLVLSIIGLSLGNSGMKKYGQNPDGYYGYGQLNAGRILSIVGLIKNIIALVFIILILSFFGMAIFAGLFGSLGEMACC